MATKQKAAPVTRVADDPQYQDAVKKFEDMKARRRENREQIKATVRAYKAGQGRGEGRLKQVAEAMAKGEEVPEATDLQPISDRLKALKFEREAIEKAVQIRKRYARDAAHDAIRRICAERRPAYMELLRRIAPTVRAFLEVAEEEEAFREQLSQDTRAAHAIGPMSGLTDLPPGLSLQTRSIKQWLAKFEELAK